MASLSLQNIKKEYVGGFVAVPDFSLEIEDKEFVIFVGPSGCGKSTTLRMIAGLEEISGGKLFIDGKLVNDVSPKDRDIAMVFQNYALYPHMTNYENMAFGLKLRKMPKDEIDRRVHEAARILGIEQFLERKPAALSGGQRQRVAMGRAIVREPKVFLMDEPLSNLDAKLRGEMRTQIAKLHKDLQTTFVYVTHDQIEAMTLGTKIVVMKDGVTQQVDSPANLYNRPCNLFVAGFIGSPTMNFVNSRVQERGEDIFVLFGDDAIKLPDGKVKELRENRTFRDYIGREVVMGIRPEDLHDEEVFLQAYPETVVNAEVELTELMGSEIHLHLVVNGQNLTAKVNPRSTAKVGDKIKLGIDAQKIHLFDKETERAILN